MSLVGLGLILILLGVFLHGLAILVTVGLILLIVGAVWAFVPFQGPYGRWPWR